MIRGTPPRSSRPGSARRRALPLLGPVFVATLFLAACGGGHNPGVQAGASALDVDAVPEEHLTPAVAVVNGVKVYKTTYEEILQILRNRIEAGDPDSVERYLGASAGALEKAIDEELLFQEAVRKGYGPSSEDLRQEYANRVAKAPSEDLFLKAARSRFLSKSEILNAIRKEIALDRYIKAEVAPRLSVTEEEVRGYYDTRPDLFTPDPWVRLGQIYVAAPIEWETVKRNAALSSINASLEKIRSGRSFESVAREDSQDPVSAQVGGLIGLFKKGNLPEKLDRAAFSLKPGGVSDVIESEDGYHVLKVYERKGGELEPFDKVHDDVKAKVLARKRNEILAGIVRGLRAPASIERYPASAGPS